MMNGQNIHSVFSYNFIDDPVAAFKDLPYLISLNLWDGSTCKTICLQQLSFRFDPFYLKVSIFG